jgi:hypothetical protein
MSEDVFTATRPSNLSVAFNRALRCAKALGKSEWNGEDLAISIASQVIDLSQRGERDPTRIADTVLERLMAA